MVTKFQIQSKLKGICPKLGLYPESILLLGPPSYGRIVGICGELSSRAEINVIK